MKLKLFLPGRASVSLLKHIYGPWDVAQHHADFNGSGWKVVIERTPKQQVGGPRFRGFGLFLACCYRGRSISNP